MFCSATDIKYSFFSVKYSFYSSLQSNFNFTQIGTALACNIDIVFTCLKCEFIYKLNAVHMLCYNNIYVNI
jgi:hypothetical protein